MDCLQSAYGGFALGRDGCNRLNRRFMGFAGWLGVVVDVWGVGGRLQTCALLPVGVVDCLNRDLGDVDDTWGTEIAETEITRRGCGSRVLP